MVWSHWRGIDFSKDARVLATVRERWTRKNMPVDDGGWPTRGETVEEC